ncbi:glycoside hydrolase family 47 protein [Gonapodya prolifera JEL478]|uniref:alpha-1,2-Mannosidase n=1 Tax=Gonapodya prolifera (strain JEL478) TaxID=1344416 RepID=A0A139A6C0_GONPJ|nr:glycoside hydrolase family 47 protein [Gonapodya prolifera JEL478]|eukprot:KXS11923.1 glycoside hydrolase family 47 protein [Gonapodya prolifera JEL478]
MPRMNVVRRVVAIALLVAVTLFTFLRYEKSNETRDDRKIEADKNGIWGKDRPVVGWAAEVKPMDPMEVGTDAMEEAMDTTEVREKDTEMLAFVRNMIRHAWSGYVTYANGFDDLKPISKLGRNWYAGGSLRNTVLDSIDTLWIAGLQKEYEEARAMTTLLSFDVNARVSFFETTIRGLGGLLSAHSLTGDTHYLQLALDLGNRLLKAVNASTGIASSAIGLHSGRPEFFHWLDNKVSTAETGSYSLEFLYLSHHTGDRRFEEAAKAITRTFSHLRSNTTVKGLWPGRIDQNVLRLIDSGQYSVGGMIDSFYEYLLKVWVLVGRPIASDSAQSPESWATVLRSMYDESVDSILTHIAINSSKPLRRPIAYLPDTRPPGTRIPTGRSKVMEHLACFIPGLLALGVETSLSKNKTRDERIMAWAEDLSQGCAKMYTEGAFGIAPEIAFMEDERVRPASDFSEHSKYLLRPEVLESLFILHRLTHRPQYRRWARAILKSIERECRVDAGYAGIKHVGKARPEREYIDLQESFFIAETLKYGYLIFESDDVIPLDEWIFNTEAHPLRILQPTL